MVLALSCPCCGAPLETSSKECSYCRTSLVIRGGRVRARTRVSSLEEEDEDDEDEPEEDEDPED